MQSFFNYDNPVWRFIGKLGDLIVLNFLWIKDVDESIGMDDASYHLESIEEKELDIDPINTYNHMACLLYTSRCV